MRRLALILALLAPGLASAQSLPNTGNVAGFYYGYLPSAANWNAFFQATQDWIGATPLTVATLPTCNGTTQYHWGLVTDASGPTYNGTLTGGGAVKVPVFCNGTAWTSH
jgi:hypothetical protein